MAVSANPDDLVERLRIFRAIAPHFGKVLPAAFFQKTSQVVPGINRIHHLIEGIYKPAWSIYPLSIASMLKSQYSDMLHHNPDRTWWIQYSPKAGNMDIAVNAALIRAMSDRQPILVLKQEYGKSDPEGSHHRFLGLGYVESFDAASNLFRIRGLEWGETASFLGLGLADNLVETALRLESLEQWTPFVAENRAVYQVSREKRDAAFSGVVLDSRWLRPP